MAEATLITNDNIREFIDFYVNDKSRLPSDLQDIPIGSWNVSEVTDMNDAFVDCFDFNEPLNEWNVSNVTYMGGMFSGCYIFNQPLDKWNVGLVRRMDFMFSDCQAFNQPLNNWDIGNVRNMTSMFDNAQEFNQPLNNWNLNARVVTHHMFVYCYISAEYLPALLLRSQDRYDAARGVLDDDGDLIEDVPQGVAFEIHNASDKIDMVKYLSIINESVKDENIESYVDIPLYVSKKFQQKIQELFPKKEQRELLDKLNAVIERATTMEMKDPNVQLQIGKTVDYVLQQEPEFIKNYIELFVESCYNAYPGSAPGLGISCAKGIRERFFMILGQMLFAMPKPERNELVSSVFGANVLDPNDLLSEWSKTWNETSKIWKDMEPDQRREDFKTFMHQKYIGNANATNIINGLVEANRYVFENKTDEEITFGGRLKRRNLIKRKTIQKRKTIKHTKKRKTMKHIKKRKTMKHIIKKKKTMKYIK